LKRDLRFRARSCVDVVRAGVRFAVSLALAFAGAGAWAIVGGVLASDLAATTLLVALSRARPTLLLDRRALRVLAGFGGSVVALKVMDAFAADIDYVAVGRILGLEALGHYTVAYRLPELVLFSVFWVFSTVAYPIYAAARSDSVAGFARPVLRALRLITVYSFPVGVGLALLARDSLEVLFGPEWAPATGPMVLIALAALPLSLGYASGDVYPAIGRPGLLLAVNVPMTVILATAVVAAAPHGIAAVAAAHLAVMSVYGLGRLYLASRLVGLQLVENLRALRPGLAAAAGVLLAAGPVRLFAPVGMPTLIGLLSGVVLGALLGLCIAGRDAIADVAAIARAARSSS
jgi:PST family polysaccharide transporter